VVCEELCWSFVGFQILYQTSFVFENLNVEEDVNRGWENVNENIKTSAKESLGLHELKRHKPWFDK